MPSSQLYATPNVQLTWYSRIGWALDPRTVEAGRYPAASLCHGNGRARGKRQAKKQKDSFDKKIQFWIEVQSGDQN